MPLQPGTKLGHYEILALIGVGGNPSRDRKGAVRAATVKERPTKPANETGPVKADMVGRAALVAAG